MKYGDEYCVEIAPGFDPDLADPAELSALFKNASRITRFHDASDGSFIQEMDHLAVDHSLCFRVDGDSMIEINDSFLRRPLVIRNEVADLISFQFVSSVKRSEFLGERKNVHDLGPAIIVTAVPGNEVTYRVPRINLNIRHVVVYATLSTLMDRMGESEQDYPNWLREIFSGAFTRPRQRVLFLEDVHRDLTWSCFHRPVTGALLQPWMTAKFSELLCIGLQVLKNNQAFVRDHPPNLNFPHGEKIRQAGTILNREYVNPPTLAALARNLGVSETQLKSGFKAMNGTTVLQYCINKRIEAARLLLEENKHSISEIADIVGYQDHSAFSRAFRRLSGCSPREWRQAGGS
ncbi:MAG: AraC family transcriptional regulator [Lysobacterales bacterium]|jgi:AraC-like DNA-binding protein